MGFLSNMLPTVIGVGVGAATGNPWLGAAAAGALKYNQTGNLGQAGLAALGGYGGAGLGQALAQQGAQQTAAAALTEEASKNAALEGFTLPANYQSMAANTMAPVAAPTGMAGIESLGKGISGLGQEGALSNLYNQGLGGGMGAASKLAAVASPMMSPEPKAAPTPAGDADMGQRYTYSANAASPTPAPDVPSYSSLSQDFGREQRYYTPAYTKISEEQAKKQYGYADGGILPGVGTANVMFPQSGIQQGQYANAWQTPVARNMFSDTADTNVNQMTGEMQLAGGGISDLGGYSDGGRLLRGPGDGVSDSIPATIANKRPARLADGEFVVPARVVSELGNGSTDAGARELYKMMDRVQNARAKTTAKGKVAKANNPQKLMPA